MRTNLDRLVGGATDETIIARVGEGIVNAIGSAETHLQVLEKPDSISKRVLEKGLDAGTAYEILSIDIADIDVGDNIGANLQALQAEADTRVARAKAEERRAFAVAKEQEMQAAVQENRAKVVEAEAEIPMAIAEAFRKGHLGIVDYYNLRNVQADTEMRNSIAGTGNARRENARYPPERPCLRSASKCDTMPPRYVTPPESDTMTPDPDFARNPAPLGTDLAAQPRDRSPCRPGRLATRPRRAASPWPPSRFARSPSPRPRRSLPGLGPTAIDRRAAPIRARSARSPRTHAAARGRSPSSPAAAKTAEPEQGRAALAARSTRAWPRPPTGRSKSPLSRSRCRRSARHSPRWEARAAARAELIPRPSARHSTAKSARAMLGSPEKLREIAILTEVLKPPLALRHRAPISLKHAGSRDSAGRSPVEGLAPGSSAAAPPGRCDCREKADFRSTANGLARSVNLGWHLQGRSARRCAAILHSRQLL